MKTMEWKKFDIEKPQQGATIIWRDEASQMQGFCSRYDSSVLEGLVSASPNKTSAELFWLGDALVSSLRIELALNEAIHWQKYLTREEQNEISAHEGMKLCIKRIMEKYKL